MPKTKTLLMKIAFGRLVMSSSSQTLAKEARRGSSVTSSFLRVVLELCLKHTNFGQRQNGGACVVFSVGSLHLAIRNMLTLFRRYRTMDAHEQPLLLLFSQQRRDHVPPNAHQGSVL